MNRSKVSGLTFNVSRKAKLFLLIILFPLTLWSQNFPDKPNPPRLVNDFTNTLAQNETASLEQKLVEFNDSSSTQIAIVIMHSVGEYEIADYTYQLGRKWGIGQQGKNNGALILVALDDHKVYIATGYGLEGVIPDALAKRIVEQDIKPEFKQGNYFAGLDKATDTMIKLASGEYTADDVGSSGNLPVANYFPFIIFILIAFFIFFSKYRSARSYAHMNGMSFWAAWMLLNAARRSGRGSWGGFSGGSGWGGGGGGGGFGGFGGGSFGGGGAGGSW